MATPKLCSVPGCGKRHEARGYCPMHYARLKKTGSAQADIPNQHSPRGVCSIDGCEKPHFAHSYCRTHDRFYRLYGDPLKRMRSPKPECCEIAGCDRPVKQNRMCSMHYMRWKSHGDPHKLLTAASGELLRFILDHLHHQSDKCVLWPFASRDEHGRPQITYKGKKMKAHRVMCLLAHGKPPRGKPSALHSCGNGHLACINPNHLYWGTQLANMKDAKEHGTWCRGERQHAAILKENDVRYIRFVGRSVSTRELAIMFGVSRSQINAILAGRAWAWLE